MGQPTMDDVARRAGVSRALVSLVMRDSPRVSKHSREAVLRAAVELGYRPNLMARNLASRRTMTIGLVLNDLHNPYFAEATDGLHRVATRSGYRIVINTGLRSAQGEQDAIDTFLQYRTDGIVIVGSWLPEDSLTQLAGETPLVMVGRSSTSTVFDTVNIDDPLGARLVVDHLVELGHQRITHLDGGGGAGAAQRRSGYIEAMEAHGLDTHIQTIAAEFTQQGGREAVDELLSTDDVPTAVFAGNDFMAAGALDRLEESGLQVPEDISLVGFDNTSFAALRRVQLTTVNQPTEILGSLAARCLIERLEQGRESAVHHVLAPSLVCRSTTAAPRGVERNANVVGL